MSAQKRVAAIHDISGFGKCSLTVALPIISVAGIETSVIPTAVLSTHTGGFTGFTYRDLTEDLRPIARHWKSLGLTFDALYSGFLGSFEQLEIVSEIFDLFKTKENLILVDPVMADNGELYSLFNTDFAAGMAKLCSKADIIVPNLTEAAFLLKREYREGPYDKAYIGELLKALAALGPSRVVLTGVWFDKSELGAACYDDSTGETGFALSKTIEGYYHGTGDVFASALLSGLLNGFSLSDSTQLAVDFTAGSIRRTYEAGTDVRFGVNFEAGLPELIRRLGLDQK
ncbi:MAG: pyridoxamine kinase [Clostridia bacterium]|nr:pyridoxamine kinase [Clostridia bacterium]MDR3645453.1 pyridoxamine kinase [Clostridia bacterium]